MKVLILLSVFITFLFTACSDDSNDDQEAGETECNVGYELKNGECVIIKVCDSGYELKAGECVAVEGCGADGMCYIPESAELPAYRIDIYEVTVSQFRACVTAEACSANNFDTAKPNNYSHSDRDNHPMNTVSWNGAKQYCEWAGKRLPSEDEWFYAAYSDDGRLHTWGNEPATCDHAVYGNDTGPCNSDISGKHTSEVGTKEAGVSPFGLHDMNGNVWEWVESCFDDTCATHILLGGAWNGTDTTSPGNRSSATPEYMSYDIGFRCAKSE